MKIFSCHRRSLGELVAFAVLLGLAWIGCGGPTGSDDNPVLTVTPGTLDFGDARVSLPLTISNIGSGVLNWSLQLSSEGWISASQTNGTVVNTPATIDIRIDRQKAPAGLQQVRLVVTGGGGQVDIILKASISRPVLRVTPDSLHFGTSEQNKSLIIQNTGVGALNWNIDVPESWVQADPSSGQQIDQSRTVTVNVDRSRFEENGIYATQVVVTSDGGTAIIPVTVDIEGKTSTALLQVSPVALAFGTTSSRRSIGITNGGRGTLDWQATSIQEWIRVDPNSGIILKGITSTQIDIEVDRSVMTPGEHIGSVDITSNGGSTTVPITVSVPTPVISLNTRDVDFRTSTV